MHTKRVLLLAGYSMTALQLSSSYYTIEVDSMMHANTGSQMSISCCHGNLPRDIVYKVASDVKSKFTIHVAPLDFLYLLL